MYITSIVWLWRRTSNPKIAGSSPAGGDPVGPAWPWVCAGTMTAMPIRWKSIPLDRPGPSDTIYDVMVIRSAGRCHGFCEVLRARLQARPGKFSNIYISLSLSLSLYIYIYVYIYIYIYYTSTHIHIYTYRDICREREGLQAHPRELSIRKGTNGVSTNGVTANFMVFDRGTFGCTPVSLLLSSQKCQGVPFAPTCQNSSFLQRPHECWPRLSETNPCGRLSHVRVYTFGFQKLPTVSFHNFKSQHFKLSVSNPKSKYVAYVSVLSQISNCQSLGRKNKHETLKTDRTFGFQKLPIRSGLHGPMDSASAYVRSRGLRVRALPGPWSPPWFEY